MESFKEYLTESTQASTKFENVLVDLLQHTFIPILVWFLVAISFIKYKNIIRII